MRIQGRTLRPSTLEERRLLLSLGLDKLRVPRGTNPFALVRKIQKVARGARQEMKIIHALASTAAPRWSRPMTSASVASSRPKTNTPC